MWDKLGIAYTRGSGPMQVQLDIACTMCAVEPNHASIGVSYISNSFQVKKLPGVIINSANHNQGDLMAVFLQEDFKVVIVQ